MHLKSVASYVRRTGTQSGVISYHNILPRQIDNAKFIHNVDISLDVFESQLAYLTSNYEIIGFDEIMSPSKKGFAISFDDGMLNNYTVVAPVLKKYNIQAMFAVCPDLVNRKIQYYWRDHLYVLMESRLGQTIKLPMDEFNFDNLNIPKDDVMVMAMMAIGYPSDENNLTQDMKKRDNQPRVRKLISEIAFKGKWK